MNIKRLFNIFVALVVLCFVPVLWMGSDWFDSLKGWLELGTNFILAVFTLWIGFETYGMERKRDREENDRKEAENTALRLATSAQDTLKNFEASKATLTEAFQRVKAGDRVLIYQLYLSNIRGVKDEKKEKIDLMLELAYRDSFKEVSKGYD